MINSERFELLRQGTDAWNAWREKTSSRTKIDLSEVKISGARLSNANLKETDLSNADLEMADLIGADLKGTKLAGAQLKYAFLTEGNLENADLTDADLRYVDLRKANLSSANLSRAKLDFANLNGATLIRAKLRGANLNRTKLIGANLEGANLNHAILVDTKLDHSNLTGCSVYGISAWNLNLNQAKQSNLVITNYNEAIITVDNLEIAQFIYLLLKREKIRNVINTITSKAVLILGRFTSERKFILEKMADELRRYNLLPIIFDFERSSARDFTETIKTLAGMSLFVIADITNPKSAPLELQATVPDYQIPFVPIIQKGEEPFSMFIDLKGKYDWILEPIEYPSLDKLLQVFKNAIIDRACKKQQELQKRKTEQLKILSVNDFLKTPNSKSDE